MAIFLASDAAFDMYQLDLNGVFQAASRTVNEAATSQLTPGIGFTIGTTNNIIQGHAILPDTHVQLDVATTQAFDLWGNGLVSDGQGSFSSGTLNRLNGAFGLGQSSCNVMGFTLDAAAFSAAAATVSSLDDLALFVQIFSHNDYVQGSTAGDVFALGRGDDVYADQGGQDRVDGGEGKDFLTLGVENTGIFADRGWGRNGDDIVDNHAGSGFLYGGKGDDLLVGALGDDHFTGGAGHDSFAFVEDFGRHKVLDFDPTEDRLIVPDGASGLGDLTITQSGANTRVSHGNWSVVLRDVDAGLLTVANVQFGATSLVEAAENAYLAGFAYDV